MTLACLHTFVLTDTNVYVVVDITHARQGWLRLKDAVDWVPLDEANEWGTAPSPDHGEHTSEILGAAGYDADEIEAFEAEGVI